MQDSCFWSLHKLHGVSSYLEAAIRVSSSRSKAPPRNYLLDSDSKIFCGTICEVWILESIEGRKVNSYEMLQSYVAILRFSLFLNSFSNNYLLFLKWSTKPEHAYRQVFLRMTIPESNIYRSLCVNRSTRKLHARNQY